MPLARGSSALLSVLLVIESIGSGEWVTLHITYRRDCDSDKIYSQYRCSKENTSYPGAGAIATAIIERSNPMLPVIAGDTTFTVFTLAFSIPFCSVLESSSQ